MKQIKPNMSYYRYENAALAFDYLHWLPIKAVVLVENKNMLSKNQDFFLEIHKDFVSDIKLAVNEDHYIMLDDENIKQALKQSRQVFFDSMNPHKEKISECEAELKKLDRKVADISEKNGNRNRRINELIDEKRKLSPFSSRKKEIDAEINKLSEVIKVPEKIGQRKIELEQEIQNEKDIIRDLGDYPKSINSAQQKAEQEINKFMKRWFERTGRTFTKQEKSGQIKKKEDAFISPQKPIEPLNLKPIGESPLTDLKPLNEPVKDDLRSRLKPLQTI